MERLFLFFIWFSAVVLSVWQLVLTVWLQRVSSRLPLLTTRDPVKLAVLYEQMLRELDLRRKELRREREELERKMELFRREMSDFASRSRKGYDLCPEFSRAHLRKVK